MQIPEGHRLQLQGLSDAERRIIIDQFSIYDPQGSLPTCLYNISYMGDGDVGMQWGEESTYSPLVRHLIPIYIAQELQETGPEQTEIDWDIVGWTTAPSVTLNTFDNVEIFEDF